MPASRTRFVFTVLLSLLVSLSAFAAPPAPACAAAGTIRVELADATATAGSTATLSATVRATSAVPVRVWYVLAPHATVQAGQPIFEGIVAPNAPYELRAVIAPLRAGLAPIAVRVESLRDGCRWIAASASLNVAAAPRPAPAREPKTMAAAPKRGKTKGGNRKVSSQLAQAAQEYAAKGNRGAASLHGVTIDDAGETRVHVRFAEGTNVEELRGRFKVSHKAEIEKSRGSIARLRVPLAALNGLAVAIPEIVQIYVPAPPQPLAVTGEGVGLTGANTRHAAGYTGTGAKVMIIDLGYAGLAAAKASGDLPASMTQIDCYLGCATTTFAGETDNHGTAVAEIVHEMAPGASLYLVKIWDELDLADAVDYAGAAGIDIITHSVGWVNYNFYDGQCWFGGPTCSTDEAIVNHGILWVNAAGNQAQRHYDALFTDANNDYDHDSFISIPNVAAGQVIEVYATWDAWPITTLDFDLDLFNPSGIQVAKSENWQDGSPDSVPVEGIYYTAQTSGTFQIRLYNYDAMNGVRFKIHSFTSNFSNGVSAWSITGPSDGQYVVSVAAVRASLYTSAAGLESYSSRGPTSDGVIAPILSAPTLVSNTTSNGFNGTSAAAPHVAGAAAVLLSQHPAWTWIELWSELVNASIDMGMTNPDTEFGYGRLNLCAGPPAPALVAPASATSGQPYIVNWNGTSPNNTYELQEATNASFTDAFTFNPVGTQFQFHRTLTATTTFYYRIRATSSCSGTVWQGPWSNTATTTVNVSNGCAITNTSQPAGETWVAGGQVNARWTKSGTCGANVRIELFSAPNVFHSTIAESTPNDLLQLWTIPSLLPTSSTYQIRIVDPTTTAESYKTVSILAAPAGPRPPNADFNSDGKHDLVWRNKDTGHVWVSTVSNGTVTGGFTLHFDSNLAWRIIGTGDFNGDGHGDVLYRNFTTGQVFVQLFNGSTLIGSGIPWADGDPAWSIIDLADFDGDRRTDILWRNSSNGKIFVLLMTGTTVKAYSTVWIEADLNWQIVAATDMNGDGKADLLWRNATTGMVFIVYLNGLSVQSTGVFNESRSTAWLLAATGDVDADGDSDLVWRHTTTGAVWVTSVNGINVASSVQIWTEPNANWRIHGMADFDANGRMDLLWRNTATGLLFLIRLNGPAVAGSGVLYNEPNLSWKIVAPTLSSVATNGNVSP